MPAILRRIILAAVLICIVTVAVSAARLSPALSSRLNGAPDTASVGLVIVAFNTSNGLSSAHVNLLRSLGITGGITYTHLGMVAVPATAVPRVRR